MKKYVFFIIILSLFLASCEDFLEEKPKEIAVSTYYNTAEEVEAGVNAIYSSYESCVNSYMTLLLDAFSDLTQGRGSFTQDYADLTSTNITRASNYWKYFYLSIRDANIIIKNAPNGTDISEEDIQKYVGEAKFLRALSYFYLVRLWGGVPIRTEENLTESNVERSSEDLVWQLIVDDLEEAETGLPDVADAVGRPSKWTAKTVLADVYFYQGLNSEAASKAKEVIDADKYSLVEVESWEDFDSKLYGTNVVGSSESIFNVMFTKSGTDLQTYLFILLNHPDAGYSGGRGNYAIYTDTLANTMYSSWDNSDIRKDLTYIWDFGLGSATMLYRKFIDPDANGGGSGNDFPIYRYADLLLLYAEASCIANNGPTSDGLEALNQVHRRAYGKKPVTQASDVDFSLADFDEDSFVDLIMEERGYETVIEGKRWFDLKRSGKVNEYFMKHKSLEVADKLLLWPIPDSEIDYNNAIDATDDQNPGY